MHTLEHAYKRTHRASHKPACGGTGSICNRRRIGSGVGGGGAAGGLCSGAGDECVERGAVRPEDHGGGRILEQDEN